jgi:hypothetical protein
MDIRQFGKTAVFGVCVAALAMTGACGKKDEAGTAPAPATNRAANTATTNTAAAPSAADNNIKAKAMQNLDGKGVTGVTVTVNGGVLTASGTVPAAKWTDAMQALNEAGATRVDNSKLVKGS